MKDFSFFIVCPSYHNVLLVTFFCKFIPEIPRSSVLFAFVANEDQSKSESLNLRRAQIRTHLLTQALIHLLTHSLTHLIFIT